MFPLVRSLFFIVVFLCDAASVQAAEPWSVDSANGWCAISRSGYGFSRNIDTGELVFGVFGSRNDRKYIPNAAVFVDGKRWPAKSFYQEGYGRKFVIASRRDEFEKAIAAGRYLVAGGVKYSLDGTSRALSSSRYMDCIGGGRRRQPSSQGDLEFYAWSGVIKSDVTAGELERSLSRYRDGFIFVIEASPGGAVGEAMRIGRYLRARRASVIVAGPCASACVLVAAGGVQRALAANGALGVHQISNKFGSFSDAQTMMAEVSIYYAEMGVDT